MNMNDYGATVDKLKEVLLGRKTAQVRTEIGTFSVTVTGNRVAVTAPHPRTPSQVALLELLRSKRKVCDRFGKTVQINGKTFPRQAFNAAKATYYQVRAVIKDLKKQEPAQSE